MICDRGLLLDATDTDQYILIHHEYAGLAGIEVSAGDVSTYPVSNQIGGYLANQVVKKLVIRPSGVLRRGIYKSPDYPACNFLLEVFDKGFTLVVAEAPSDGKVDGWKVPYSECQFTVSRDWKDLALYRQSLTNQPFLLNCDRANFSQCATEKIPLQWAYEGCEASYQLKSQIMDDARITLQTIMQAVDRSHNIYDRCSEYPSPYPPVVKSTMLHFVSPRLLPYVFQKSVERDKWGETQDMNCDVAKAEATVAAVKRCEAFYTSCKLEKVKLKPFGYHACEATVFVKGRNGGSW